jgi:hypothetical protein
MWPIRYLILPLHLFIYLLTYVPKIGLCDLNAVCVSMNPPC